MQNGFFALIQRMRNIRRWGLMRNSFDENLQEHSHTAAVLAHALAMIRREVYGEPADPDRAAVLALFHDASEIITGDLPTPVKYLNRDITGAYKAVERQAEGRLLAMLPEELRPGYAPLLGGGEGSGLGDLVKAADKLSAYLKCQEELQMGNTEFRSAEKQLRAWLDACPLREVRYFTEHFLPSFGLTLDELTGEDQE